MFLKITARYVNTKGVLSRNRYDYAIDPFQIKLGYEMKSYQNNLKKLFSPNEKDELLMFYIANKFGKKHNPIIVENYKYEDKWSDDWLPLSEISVAGIYDPISEKRVSEIVPTKYEKVMWNGVCDKGSESTSYQGVDDIDRQDCWVYAPKNNSTAVITNETSNDSLTASKSGSWTTTTDTSTLSYTAQATAVDYSPIYTRCPYYEENCSKKERFNNMNFNKMFKGIEFGKITDGSIVMSIYGPAFRTADGGYIAHQGAGDYVDADGFLFDGNDSFCFKMPVAQKQVGINDIIVHNKKYCRIIDRDDRGDFVVEDIMDKEVKTIMAVRSPFGFDFYTKVITFGEDMFKADKDNPFGSILPMMMLMGEGKSNDSSMMMAMMMQNGSMEMDPMMMYFMMGGSAGGNDMLPMLMMMQNGMFTPKAKDKCNCGCGCDEATMTDEEIAKQIL